MNLSVRIFFGNDPLPPLCFKIFLSSNRRVFLFSRRVSMETILKRSADRRWWARSASLMPNSYWLETCILLEYQCFSLSISLYIYIDIFTSRLKWRRTAEWCRGLRARAIWKDAMADMERGEKTCDGFHLVECWLNRATATEVQRRSNSMAEQSSIAFTVEMQVECCCVARRGGG